MAIVSSGQITLTDLSDAPILSAFITASANTTQVYDATAQTWNPSYGTTAQTLTLNLTKAGSSTSILSGLSGSVTWTRIDNGVSTAITSTTNTDAQYLSGTSNSVLTTKVNVPINGNGSRFIATGNWLDPISGLLVPFSASIDLFVVQLAKSPLIANVYAGSGSVFYNQLPASLTVNADLYKGGQLSSGAKQIKFFYASSSVTSTGSTGYDADGGLGWYLCQTNTVGASANVAPTNTTFTGQGVLTVTPDFVTNAMTFKAVIIDKTGGTSGQSSSGIVTIIDFSDPISITIESTAGNVFKNGQGTTNLTARLYQSGGEIDTAGTKYTYKWSKRDRNGVLDPNFGGTGNQYKTGKTISVTASDITVKGTYTCEVNG